MFHEMFLWLKVFLFKQLKKSPSSIPLLKADNAHLIYSNLFGVTQISLRVSQMYLIMELGFFFPHHRSPVNMF